jgi:hypothetical protein
LFPWALRLASYRCTKQCIQCRKELLKLLLEPLYHRGSNAFIQPKSIVRPWHHHQRTWRLLSPSRPSYAAIKRKHPLMLQGCHCVARQCPSPCGLHHPENSGLHELEAVGPSPIQPRPGSMRFPCVQPPQDAPKACRVGSDEGVKAVVV